MVHKRRNTSHLDLDVQSNPLTVSIENKPPYTPDIVGERKIKMGKVYEYKVFTVDSDDDEIYIILIGVMVVILIG